MTRAARRIEPTNGFDLVAQLGTVGVGNPRAVGAGPGHLRGPQLVRVDVVGVRPCDQVGGKWRTEAVRAEICAGRSVEETQRPGAVVERRPNGPQHPVADVDVVAGVDDAGSVERRGAGGCGPPEGQEGSENCCLGSQLEKSLQGAGVVAVLMGQPDPFQFRQFHAVGEGVDKIRREYARAGVDQNRLGGMQQEGVHRDDTHARDRPVGREDIHPGRCGERVADMWWVHGVTRPISLDLEFNGVNPGMGHGEVAGFEASVVLNRKDFGVDIDIPLETGGAVVGDKVTITLEIEALKQA